MVSSILLHCPKRPPSHSIHSQRFSVMDEVPIYPNISHILVILLPPARDEASHRVGDDGPLNGKQGFFLLPVKRLVVLVLWE